MNDQNPNQPLNPGEQIGAGLDAAAQAAEALNQSGIKTGKASTWLQVGGAIAHLGGSIARIFRRR